MFIYVTGTSPENSSTTAPPDQDQTMDSRDQGLEAHRRSSDSVRETLGRNQPTHSVSEHTVQLMRDSIMELKSRQRGYHSDSYTPPRTPPRTHPKPDFSNTPPRSPRRERKTGLHSVQFDQWVYYEGGASSKPHPYLSVRDVYDPNQSRTDLDVRETKRSVQFENNDMQFVQQQLPRGAPPVEVHSQLMGDYARRNENYGATSVSLSRAHSFDKHRPSSRKPTQHHTNPSSSINRWLSADDCLSGNRGPHLTRHRYYGLCSSDHPRKTRDPNDNTSPPCASALYHSVPVKTHSTPSIPLTTDLERRIKNLSLPDTVVMDSSPKASPPTKRAQFHQPRFPIDNAIYHPKNLCQFAVQVLPPASENVVDTKFVPPCTYNTGKESTNINSDGMLNPNTRPGDTSILALNSDVVGSALRPVDSSFGDRGSVSPSPALSDLSDTVFFEEDLREQQQQQQHSPSHGAQTDMAARSSPARKLSRTILSSIYEEDGTERNSAVSSGQLPLPYSTPIDAYEIAQGQSGSRNMAQLSGASPALSNDKPNHSPDYLNYDYIPSEGRSLKSCSDSKGLVPRESVCTVEDYDNLTQNDRNVIWSQSSEPRIFNNGETTEGGGNQTSSFGRRSPSSSRRTSECLTLEPSEMIVIDYPDATAMKSASVARAVVSTSNVQLLGEAQPSLNKGNMRRMNSDSVIEHHQMPIEEIAAGSLPHPIMSDSFPPPPPGLDQPNTKRFSRASDTSSAYSGSDVMHTSIDDGEGNEVDLSGLAESNVDSDDEEGYAESTESLTIRDAERDCLEKEPSERTEEDIQILLSFTQHLKAFSNMTEHTRRLLCEVMVFAIVPKAGTIVMKDGEELDSWSVILNGEVEITRPNGGKESLYMGDSFGIRPTMEKLYHQGVMRTVVNDCQFVCIAQSSYYRILHQGQENIRKHEEKGQVVMVTEHRELEGGQRKGHIVIRGTADRLMQHLVESHSAIDPSYVEDFLLTYRTFLKSPLDLVKRLLDWFKNDDLKTNVTRVVLLWVNNHFNDFETNQDMCDFLEHFECLLEKEKMMGQLNLLNMACAAKARVRTVTLTRATREEYLNFSILGGLERGHGIFVTKVHPQSKAAEAGLKRGDQILEVNGQKFHQIYYNKALEILKGTTHLSITIKSNLQEFKEMLRTTEKNTPRKVKREDSGNVPNPKQRLSVPDLDSTVPIFGTDGNEKQEKRGGLFSSTSRLRKALTRLNFVPKNLNGRESSSINHSDESLYSKPSRKSSTSSSSSNTTLGLSNHFSASNPDITSVGLIADDRHEMPEHVVKVYRSDQSFKYLLIHKETTAKEVVMLALQEFGITEPSCNFSLREVTVEMEKFIKSKRLPDTLSNLPDRLNLNGRYYLKNNLTSEPLIPDDMVGQLLAESQIALLQLTAHEVAWQLTLNDYKVFREIEPTEYVDDLYKLDSKFGCHQLHKFADLVNHEMFWVVTEICSETNLVKRTKLLKHFINIAKFCKDYKNFNSMFAILSGLGHGSISRLKLTWERLPSKYCRLFNDLSCIMDPSRNMAKYRNLINSEHVQPPYIPFYPIFKKDLTFIHLGNDTYVDGLINFEKLRMIAKEVRHICNICSTKYDSNNMFLTTNTSFQSAIVSGVTTLKRTKNRRGSALPNAKKMYEEAQMVRRVKSYLSNMPVISDEEKLTELSNACEPSIRKRDPSPSVNNSPNMEDKRIVGPQGPKFGAESPGAVRKLMALSDKVKPHNPKIPVGKVASPTPTRRSGGPTSPRIGPASRPLPVNLTPESSCLGTGIRKQPHRTGSMGSTDSASPTGSMRGFKAQYSSENDSGHSSVGSNVSPPTQHRRLTAPAGPVYCTVPSLQRPPLPSYSTVMHNSAAAMSAPIVSNYTQHPGFPIGRRPPLPDYQAATTMAQMARRQQQQQQQMRSYSHDAGVYIGVGHGPVTAADSDYDTPPVDGGDEEQVSAV